LRRFYAKGFEETDAHRRWTGLWSGGLGGIRTLNSVEMSPAIPFFFLQSGGIQDKAIVHMRTFYSL
jgi:hypothetical protein